MAPTTLSSSSPLFGAVSLFWSHNASCSLSPLGCENGQVPRQGLDLDPDLSLHSGFSVFVLFACK
jgi:hypothetical protein